MKRIGELDFGRRSDTDRRTNKIDTRPDERIKIEGERRWRPERRCGLDRRASVRLNYF